MHDLPRALRVGIISDKRVILERLLPPGSAADLGSDPRCALRVPGQQKSLRLFSHRKGAYYLNIQQGMAGVIARGDQRVALPGGGRLAILEGDRGKVSVGELTILFQLVPAPPEMLGRSGFRRELVEQEDTVFAGFLSLTSALATVLVALVQLTPPIVITSIEDHRPRLVQVYKLPDPEPPTVEIEHREAPREVMRRAQRQVQRLTDPLTEATDRARQHAEREGAPTESAMIGLLRTHGPTAFDANGDEELMRALERFPSAEPVASAAPLGMRAGRGGLDRGGTVIGDLEVGGPGGPAQVRDDLRVSAPKERQGIMKAPVPDLPDVPDGERDLIRQAVKRQAPQVRACYERRLKEVPNLSGKLVVAVRVENGQVREAAVEVNTTEDDELASCVEKAVVRWRFAEMESAAFELPFALSIAPD